MAEKNSRLTGKINELSEDLDLEEKDPDYKNIEKEIEKNLLIRVMPRKFKLSNGDSTKSSRAVGAAIIIVGILVMIAAIYLGYIFFINPKKISLSESEQSITEAQVEKEELNTELEEEILPKPEEELSAPAVSEEKEDWVSSATSTAMAENSSSTPAVASSTLAEKQTVSGVDADSDGLTDAEETILGTNPLKADSDGDTYGDLSELINGYNPAGAGDLSANFALSVYKSGSIGYSALIPTAWSIKETGQGESVIFSAPDNSFFQITGDLNSLKKDILSWYNSQFSDEPASADKVVFKNGWQGIYSTNKNIFYLTDDGKNDIYSLSYVPSDSAKEPYKNIFQVLVNNFILK